MKKIYTYALGLAALAATSCSDFLDKMPSDSLGSEVAITSVKDIKLAINGVSYIVSQDRMTYSADFGIYADLLGGDFIPLSNNNQSGPIARYQLHALDLIPDNAYYYFYKAIANVNSALEKAQELEVSAEEKATYDYYIGQLYAWRAMLHFDLARMFAQAPTASADVDAANSGIVLSTQVYAPTYTAARTTLKETYDQVIKDYTTAIDLLDVELDAESGVKKADGYIGYYAAQALRSRANLYYGKYEEALADATSVIENGGYKLYTRENYLASWIKTFDTESIFELKISQLYNAQRNSLGYYTSGAGYAECAFNTGSALYAHLTDANVLANDVRALLVDDQKEGDQINGETVTTAGIYPAKYPGRDGSSYINNPKIIRLADVYLIAAECEVHLGNATNAAPYINELRATRIQGYADVASVTLDEVLFERRVELFAENSFAFDMWRNQKSITNMEGKEIAHDHTMAILPIPQRELDKAGSILVQNPGW